MTLTLPKVPIVGVGASAGGLAAFTELLQHLDPTTGLAFVLVQHLDATHPSMLAETLQRATAMRVLSARDGLLVEANHVYVIAPNTCLGVEAGRLVVEPRPSDHPPAKRHPLHLPVDFFFRALAEENGKLSIGVVLSGNASDGTEGLRAIKEAGGIALAQDPSTAGFDGMPRSAIDAGLVDTILAVPAIARELARLSQHAYLRSSDAPEGSRGSSWDAIFALVREASGIDFREYKRPTLERRLERRMALQRTDNLDAYLAILRTTPAEVAALTSDSLIHVTSFFRDEDAFLSLEQHVLPAILASKQENDPVRIWVPGCSTGEEVYSLAISLADFLGNGACAVQIFGSDVSASALRTARAGVYQEAAVQALGEERRAKHFIKTEQGYRVAKALREQCVFVQHDVARDPPFSKLDLISCRNLLIYFDAQLQQRVAARFHFALNEPGFLMLGRNEAMDGFKQLFRSLDKANKLFERTAVTSTLRLSSLADSARFDLPFSPVGQVGSAAPHQVTLSKMIDRMLAARYAPPGVVVNEKLEVLQFYGYTGAFLEPPPGVPQNNLLQMARVGLSLPLRTGVAKAKEQAATVRSEGLEVTDHGVKRVCDLVFIPLPSRAARGRALFLILFEERRTDGWQAVPAMQAAPVTAAEHRVAQLEEELASIQDYLQTVLSEHGQSSEYFETVNEELVSSNEELQSLNEELGTAKEEMQSINEELSTVNDELHQRNHEVTQANSDLMNLLTAVDVPMLILDGQRKIRHFTPKARRILNVLPADLGRPFDDIKSNLDVPNFDTMIGDAIVAMRVSETEVQDCDGAWHRLQIRPYHTIEGRIDGAIISLFDIDVLKRSVADAQRANSLAELASRAKDDFLATLSHELRTPLTSMLIRAQLLRRDVLDDPTQIVRSAVVIEEGILAQIRLVDDLLDVSRIASGSFALNRQRVRLEDVIGAALDGLSPDMERKPLRLELDLKPTGWVLGDATRLQQVVANLVSNAIKFTPAHGLVQVSLSSGEGRAVVCVRDDGIGIPADFLPRIFQRFTQANCSSTRDHQGLGLGLAIAHHLVELHGGEISAESAGAGLGALFTVSLPLQPADSHE